METVVCVAGRPRFATPAEYGRLTSSTPACFDALPALERLTLDGVRVELSGIDEHADWSGLTCTLYLTNRELALYDHQRARSLLVPYRSISLHALSRNQGERPSIYCQLDESIERAEHDDHPDGPETRELIMIPDDPSRVDEIFETMSSCASAHPPTNTGNGNSQLSDDSAFDLVDDSDDGELSSARRAELDRLDALVVDSISSSHDHPVTPVFSNGSVDDQSTDTGTRDDGRQD